MRKALIGIILAATVMTPFAAQAQRWRDGDRGSASRGGGDRGGGDRGGWQGRNNGGGDNRAARIESRNEPRQAPQQQAPQPQQQVAQQPRGDGGNRGGNWNRGGNNDGNRGGNWNGNRGGNNDGRWNRGGETDRGRREQPSSYPQAWQGNPNDPRLQHYRDLERRNQNQGYDRGRRGDRDGRDWRNDRNWRDGRRGDRRNWRNEWNRGWRNDNRYNWSYWRSRDRNRYRLSPYYSPYRNWSYRRFSVGLFLDSLFYSQRYWIGDPWQYRLPPAPYGTQWVRYYNDVILVDIYTGEVVDVIYDFFW